MTSASSIPRRLIIFGLALVAIAAGCSDSSGSSSVSGVEEGVAGIGVVRFTDVATDVGLDFRHGAFRWSVTADPPAMMGAGLCWIDVDADGWLDLFVVNTWSDGEWSRWNELGDLPGTRLYRNEQGQFRDVTDSMGADLEIRGSGCTAADLDGDGFTDLYVTTERENLLLWNDGGRRFEVDDGSAGADAYGWHTGAAIGDINRDGWPDLFVAGYANLNRPIPEATRGFPNTFVAEPDLLLLSQGAEPGGRPHFVDMADEVGVERSQVDYGLGAVFSDVDRDGDLDLHVANDTQPNRLYLNEADAEGVGFRLVDRAGEAGVADDSAGMGIASGDFDADGRPDLVVTNMAEQGHNVFSSRANDAGVGASPTFTSAVDALGLSAIGQRHTGWGTVWADLDLDGDLDLVLAHGAIPVTDLEQDRQPVQVFEQRLSDPGAARFVEIADVVEGGGQGRYLARGLAAADYDNDGDVDLAVGTIGGDLALLRNDGARGQWLTVVTVPSTPGTVITVTTADGNSQYREIMAGSSYLSSEDPRAHFGFGTTNSPVTVEVRWPDDETIVNTGVEVGQVLVVERPVTTGREHETLAGRDPPPRRTPGLAIVGPVTLAAANVWTARP